MSDKRSSSDEYRDIKKKLHKSERRMSERLQEAQEEQAKALERFRRAEARLLKRMARTQRVEGRLTVIRQQLEALSISQVSPRVALDKTAASQEKQPSVEMVVVELVQDQQDEQAAQPEGSSTPKENLDTLPVGEMLQRQATTAESMNNSSRDVQTARSVAEVAEQEARLAIERAHVVSARLEQMGSGRHLMQELADLEAEVDRANARARETAHAVQQSEQQVDKPVHVDIQAVLPVDEIQLTSGGDGDTFNGEEQPLASASSDTKTQEGPSAVERERVAEIDEEEGMVEMVAAMMIADVTAATAAETEALAEASSARVREALRIAQQADDLLEKVRAAIRNGTLMGDAAEATLQDAERDATWAHAVLADAEVAEERARRAAMDAEAEAEVAEGMSFAADDRGEYAEIVREQEPPPAHG